MSLHRLHPSKDAASADTAVECVEYVLFTYRDISALFVADHRCSRTYTPSENKEELTRICRDNVCRCTQGKVTANSA